MAVLDRFLCTNIAEYVYIQHILTQATSPLNTQEGSRIHKSTVAFDSHHTVVAIRSLSHIATLPSTVHQTGTLSNWSTQCTRIITSHEYIAMPSKEQRSCLAMNCPSDCHVLPMYTEHHMSILLHLPKRCLYTSLYTATTEDIRTNSCRE